MVNQSITGKKKSNKFEILDSHSGISKDSSPLEYYSVSTDEELLMCRRVCCCIIQVEVVRLLKLLDHKKEALGFSETSVNSYQ
jgi:hypothetical protein